MAFSLLGGVFFVFRGPASFLFSWRQECIHGHSFSSFPLFPLEQTGGWDKGKGRRAGVWLGCVLLGIRVVGSSSLNWGQALTRYPDVAQIEARALDPISQSAPVKALVETIAFRLEIPFRQCVCVCAFLVCEFLNYDVELGVWRNGTDLGGGNHNQNMWREYLVNCMEASPVNYKTY